MTFKPEVQAVLDSPLIARLSVVDGNGYPHTVPSWFGVDGDDMVMISDRNTRKVDFLAANTKASICNRWRRRPRRRSGSRLPLQG